MSGYSGEKVLSDFAFGSQLAFLHKPFTIAELLEVVRSVMQAAAGNTPPGPDAHPN